MELIGSKEWVWVAILHLALSMPPNQLWRGIHGVHSWLIKAKGISSVMGHFIPHRRFQVGLEKAKSRITV